MLETDDMIVRYECEFQALISTEEQQSLQIIGPGISNGIHREHHRLQNIHRKHQKHLRLLPPPPTVTYYLFTMHSCLSTFASERKNSYNECSSKHVMVTVR